MSTADATMDSHHDGPGKAREAFRTITRDVAWVAEAPKPHKAWLAALGVALILFAIGLYSIYVLVTTGIGVWGNSNTVDWAWDITNFVWWIGIGHAGTLISAILLLFRQQWRTSINRFAEAMTLAAVACFAGGRSVIKGLRTLRVKETDEDGIFEVCGRGELHLTILLENMRREGYEMAVSKPRVLFKEIKLK